MGTVLNVLLLVALFLLFPLIRRERAGGCGGKGCWKQRAGFDCGDCPVGEAKERKGGTRPGGQP